MQPVNPSQEVLAGNVVRFPDRATGSLTLRVEVADFDGQLGCVRLELVATGGRPIETRDLRSIALGPEIDEIARHLAGLANDDSIGDGWAAAALDLAAGHLQGSLPDVRSALVAHRYVEALNDGWKPRLAVARAFGVTLSNAGRMIDLARRRGMLTPAPTRGSHGGSITPRALEVLEHNGLGPELERRRAARAERRRLAAERYATEVHKRAVTAEEERQRAERKAWAAHQRKKGRSPK